MKIGFKVVALNLFYKAFLEVSVGNLGLVEWALSSVSKHPFTLKIRVSVIGSEKFIEIERVDDEFNVFSIQGVDLRTRDFNEIIQYVIEELRNDSLL